jgi:hypothetical protein
MVIHDLNIFCTRFPPTEADAPLIVYTNAILAGTVTFKLFKAISGRYSQILKPTGNLNLSELAPRQSGDIYKPFHSETVREGFSISTFK